MGDETMVGTCEICGRPMETDGRCASCLSNAASDHHRPPSLVDGVGPRLRLVVAVDVDRDYFAEVVTEEEITFPEPSPAQRRVELSGSEIHIGRTNESTAVRPDLDVAEMTGDPAVSSRHAVIRRNEDGELVIIDVGSTNGTFLSEVDSVAIQPGEPTALPIEAPIYLGAWTRLRVVSVEPAD